MSKHLKLYGFKVRMMMDGRKTDWRPVILDRPYTSHVEAPTPSQALHWRSYDINEALKKMDGGPDAVCDIQVFEMGSGEALAAHYHACLQCAEWLRDKTGPKTGGFKLCGNGVQLHERIVEEHLGELEKNSLAEAIAKHPPLVEKLPAVAAVGVPE